MGVSFRARGLRFSHRCRPESASTPGRGCPDGDDRPRGGTWRTLSGQSESAIGRRQPRPARITGWRGSGRAPGWPGQLVVRVAQPQEVATRLAVRPEPGLSSLRDPDNKLSGPPGKPRSRGYVLTAESATPASATPPAPAAPTSTATASPSRPRPRRWASWPPGRSAQQCGHVAFEATSTLAYRSGFLRNRSRPAASTR